MGKASKRHTGRRAQGQTAATGGGASSPPPAPFERRPFAGLAAETEWVALRELLPAATAAVRFAEASVPEGAPADALFATVLPMAWPALHRQGGDILVATQAGATSGDVSRDLAAAWLLAADAPEGTPVVQVPTATTATPRLQELVDPAVAIEATVHEGFDFWVGDTELDDDAKASLEQANSSIVPTVRVEGAPSVFWVRFGERCFVRWVLPHNEDHATDGLARLAAADAARIDPDSRLLGAFRACGLLVPVWEVEPQAEPASFAAAVEACGGRLEEAIGSDAPLTAPERRARNGLLSRQVTLR